MKKEKFKGYHIVSLIILIVLAMLWIFPIVWMFFTSFKTNADILVNRTALLPQEWTIIGYVKAFTDVPFLRWLLNSMIVTVTITVAVLVTSTLLGFIFAKFEFKGKNVLFRILLATMMVPAQVTMIPRFLIVRNLGLYNKLGALIVPMLISAFGVYLCKQFIEDIPDSICDSAKIDGASSFTIYRHIILPNIKPAIGSLTIFTALANYNDYLNPLIMLNDKERMTLPLALSMFSTQNTTDLTTTMAVASLIMVPMILVFIKFQKQFVQGLALSGIK